MNEIAKGLKITIADRYYNTMKDTDFPDMKEFANRVPYYHNHYDLDAVVETKIGSHNFISFFKNPLNEVNFYEDIVSSHLEDSLFVESWGRPIMHDTE